MTPPQKFLKEQCLHGCFSINRLSIWNCDSCPDSCVLTPVSWQSSVSTGDRQVRQFKTFQAAATSTTGQTGCGCCESMCKVLQPAILHEWSDDQNHNPKVLKAMDNYPGAMFGAKPMFREASHTFLPQCGDSMGWCLAPWPGGQWVDLSGSHHPVFSNVSV